MIGGVTAGILAVWRSKVTERQSTAAELQAETARQNLLNDRYQRGADMLGSNVLAVRLGGIYALQGLAERDPERYHVLVMRQLCSFVRHPTEVEGQPIVTSTEFELGEVFGATTIEDMAAAGTEEVYVVREDIQAAMDSISSCHDRSLRIEASQNYWLDLHGADLGGTDLTGKNLSRAQLDHETQPSSNFQRAGYLWTDMRRVKMDHAILAHTDLTHVDLSGALGLTQSSLDYACADPRMPPRLESAFDVETGKLLSGKTLRKCEREH